MFEGAANIEDLVRILQELVDTVTERAEADVAAFREAYALGFAAGREVGRSRLEYELAEVERHRRHIMGLPAYAELEARRWDGRREDFGAPRPGDFPGAAVSPRRPRSRPTAGR